MKLSYRSYGDPTLPPLVLLHGLLGSRDNWHTFAQNREKTFHTIVPDLINHGESPHSGFFSYATMAADVLLLLDELDIDSCGCIGHSMGGKVAMEIALSSPNRVSTLVVEDMVPGKTSARYLKYVEILRGMDLTSINSRSDADARLSAAVGDKSFRLFLLKNLTRNNDGSYQMRANLDSISKYYQNVWAGLDPGRTFAGRSLFVRGGLSDTVSDARIDELRSYFPGAIIETIDGAGHWIHTLFSERFDAIVVPFLMSP